MDLVVAEFELPLLPWRLLGGGLSGLNDTPSLVGLGSLTPGTPARISLRGAFPSSIAIVFVGFSTLELPFLGGTLVPWPDVWFSLPTDADGELNIPLTWPELTQGSSLWFQLWVLDPGAPEFFSASNGLQAISQ
jgi:hypothetical protein